MLSPYEPLQCVFEVPGEAGFAIFGVTVKDDPDRVFEADVLADHARVLHHGDIVIVTGRRRRDGSALTGPAMHLAVMVHKDDHGRMTVTKLLELPHDAESLRNLLAGIPAALRQGREGAPTETRPPRKRVFPERTRIADGPSDGLAHHAIAGTRDAELAARRGERDRARDHAADDGADTTAATTAATTAEPYTAEPARDGDHVVTDGPGTHRRESGQRRGMNLR